MPIENKAKIFYRESREDDLLVTEYRLGRPDFEKRKVKGHIMAWVFLVVAGLLEIVWAFCMKKSAGFTLFWPTVLTLVTMIASFVMLSVSLKSIPLGTAYTVWTGIGAVGAFLVGIMILGETANPIRLLAAGLILAGIVMMKAA